MGTISTEEDATTRFGSLLSACNANSIVFYEVLADEAAFADHQQTRQFKDIIVGQAIPKLARAVPVYLDRDTPY